jgi:hypothetical protein
VLHGLRVAHMPNHHLHPTATHGPRVCLFSYLVGQNTVMSVHVASVGPMNTSLELNALSADYHLYARNAKMPG